MESIRKIKSVAAIITIFLLFSFIVDAQEKLSPTLEKGIGQYKHENYEEALPLLKKAREEDPSSTLAAYYLGLTYKQLQDYKNATPHLRDAVTYSPKIKGALIELVDCLYQTGDTEEAMKWIAEAEREGIRPAQVSFLKGLILSRMGKGTEAVAAFTNSKELDRSMTQSCDYQIGIAFLKDKKFKEARSSFEQIVLVDPNSSMANFANEYMSAIEKREEATKPLKLNFGVAWQYDDNVVLEPSDSSAATNISNKADSREVYTGGMEYDHRYNDMIGLKSQYFFYYGKQNDLGFYDIVSNTVALQPSVYLKDGLLTIPVSYNHTYVNDKPYLSTPSVAAIFNQVFGTRFMAQVFSKYQGKDYLWKPTVNTEDRDGNDFTAGGGFYLFYAKNKGFFNLRYGVNKEETKGSNWDNWGQRVTATLLIPVIEKLNLTLTSDMFFQRFTNTHTVYQVERKDDVYTLSALAAYRFYKESELQVQYTMVKDNSNITIYDYRRNIISLGVNCKF